MKTQEILSIVALALLGLCFLCGLAKMAMKKDSDKKNCDKVCTMAIFAAIALVGVSQLLTEMKKLPTPGKPTVRKGLGENCTVGAFPGSGLQADCQNGLVCKSSSPDLMPVCMKPPGPTPSPTPSPTQKFSCKKVKIQGSGTPIRACQPTPGGEYTDKATCIQNCIPYMNTAPLLGKKCSGGIFSTECTSEDKTYGDLECNGNTGRCEFKPCKDICMNNSNYDGTIESCQQTSGGPCTSSGNANPPNKDCTRQKFLAEDSSTVATSSAYQEYPAYVINSYGSCKVDEGEKPPFCRSWGQDNLEGSCYITRNGQSP